MYIFKYSRTQTRKVAEYFEKMETSYIVGGIVN
jgi:hypothetical protein